MSKFETTLLRLPFHKIATCYVFFVIIFILSSMTAIGIVFHDRVAFVSQYAAIDESLMQENTINLQSQLSSLANLSTDMVDILVLDDTNHVLWSAKNSDFSQGTFDLTYDNVDKHRLVSSTYPQAVFQYVSSERFLLSAVFNMDLNRLNSNFKNAGFFEENFSSKTVYMLGFLSNPSENTKIYIIAKPTDIAGGLLTLKIIASIAMLLFMVYWVLLSLWSYKRACISKISPLFWGFAVLLTNIAGVMVYQLYKRGYATCQRCGMAQNKLHLYCTNCGQQFGVICKSCNAHVSTQHTYCHHCGNTLQDKLK